MIGAKVLPLRGCLPAQQETLNLATGCFRQAVHEFDPARIGVGRQPVTHLLLKLPGQRLVAGVAGAGDVDKHVLEPVDVLADAGNPARIQAFFDVIPLVAGKRRLMQGRRPGKDRGQRFDDGFRIECYCGTDGG